MNKDLQVVILWRGKKRFKWFLTDGLDVFGNGEQPTVILARAGAADALMALRYAD